MFRLIVLSVVVVVGLLSAPIWEKAEAASVRTAVQQGMTSVGNDLLQHVYYTYHGRKYQYRYNGRYYNHRYYRNHRWHYY